MSDTDIRLSEMVAARLCHDIGSPLSTLTAIMPQATDSAAYALLNETAAEMGQRHRLLCAAFGTLDELRWDEIGELLRGAPMAHRVRFGLGGPPPLLREETGRLLLAAALLAAEALPRGGEVRVDPLPGERFSVLPTGRDARWSEAMLRLMGGGPIEEALAEGPRRVLAPWVLRLAQNEGRDLAFALPAGDGPPALVIGAPA